MFVLKQVNIFPKRYHNPDIVITYTTNKDNTLDMFKMWISDECKNDIEIIDIANKLYFDIIVNNENKPSQQDIFRAYQRLYYNKQWNKYEEKETKFNVKSLITKAPYNNYTEITRTFLSETYEELMNKYIREFNV